MDVLYATDHPAILVPGALAAVRAGDGMHTHGVVNARVHDHPARKVPLVFRKCA
jgi:hypothetical protein